MAHSTRIDYAAAAIVALFLMVVAWGNVSLSDVVSVRTFDVRLDVSSQKKAWVDGGDIVFQVPAGQNASVTVDVSNNASAACIFKISTEGQLAGGGWVEISPQGEFALDSGQNKQVDVSVSVPDDAKGSYSGKITVLGRLKSRL